MLSIFLKKYTPSVFLLLIETFLVLKDFEGSTS